MKIVGLCGGSGAGKGFVGQIFADGGIPVIDTDAVYHGLVSGKSPCLDELRATFGDGIIAHDGSLDRVKLAAIAFSDEHNHKMLNKIAHRHVLDKVREIISELESDGARAVLVDAPMLFESGFDSECDLVIGVIADEKTRLKRIIERDGISEERAIARISSQLPNDELIKRCDVIIENNGTDSLFGRVSEIRTLIMK